MYLTQVKVGAESNVSFIGGYAWEKCANNGISTHKACVSGSTEV